MEDYIRSYTTIFFKGTDIFPGILWKKCKNNTNEAQFLLLEVKNNINRMAMEQVLNAQVVVLCQKDLKYMKQIKIKIKLNSISKVSL